MTAAQAEQPSHYKIRILQSMREIDKVSWDAVANPAHRPSNPFISHDFLLALEESGSAVPETGWLGQHMLLEDDAGNLIGALPCYLKNHSQGEYVFDHGWADAFYRAGGEYYPKLQASVPFTPATGPRFLCANEALQGPVIEAICNGLEQMCRRLGTSSAHITFLPQSEWEMARDNGLLARTDRQFHWHNHGFEDFDGFLATLASRKRKNIRKERKTAVEPGIEIEWLTGAQLTEPVWDAFYEFYMDTGSRKWGRPYLTRKFFSLIGERMADRTVLIMAKRAGRHVAGAINFVGGDCLYGRHWGCVEDHPCLHFEVCYYQAIDYAIAHKLARVEAGAQGEHKLARGYEPVTTYSAHYIANASFREAIADYLLRERKHVEMEREILADHAPFRKDPNAQR